MTRIFVAAMTCAILATPALAEPHRYELDPTHTVVAFTVEHIGYSNTLGVFGEVEGSFTYDMETQELSDLEVRVTTDSVNTFNQARDGHVRADDFLDVRAHPVMTFTASGGQPASATSGTVTGELSLLGQTQPLSLDVTLNKAANYPFGHQKFTLGITARGTLNRSDFGMDYGVANGLVGDRVDLIIETEAIQAD